MNRFRALASQSPAIVISLIALAFSLGSGAGYAATTVTAHSAAPQRAASSVTWHTLSLLNGWQAYGSGYRAPSYAIINGVVYLTGGLDQPSNNGNGLVAVLPKSARPDHTVGAAAYSETSGQPQDVTIYKNGDVYFTEEGDTYFFSSLGGISFPVGA